MKQSESQGSFTDVAVSKFEYSRLSYSKWCPLDSFSLKKPKNKSASIPKDLNLSHFYVRSVRRSLLAEIPFLTLPSLKHFWFLLQL